MILHIHTHTHSRAALTPSHPSSEQVLHLWLEVLCSSIAAVEKWYHPWSFLRSPGWVQIKCELRWETIGSINTPTPHPHPHLQKKNKDRKFEMFNPPSRPSRVLSKFAFSLSQDCELPDKKEVSTARLHSASSAPRPEC